MIQPTVGQLKLLDESDAPSFLYRCGCGEDFIADAALEENCFWTGRANTPQCPKCGAIDMAIGGFEKGDRVAYKVIPIVRHLAKHGTVLDAWWSNDDGYSEHISVKWDTRDPLAVPEVLTISPGRDYPIRKLDAVEALAGLEPPPKLDDEPVSPGQEGAP